MLAIFVYLMFFSVCLGQLDEVDVIQSEMSPEMEKFVVGETLLLLSQEKNFPIVAESLIQILNKQFGKEWIALIGTNLHTTIIGMKVVKSTMLLMEYRDIHVLVARIEIEQGSTDNRTSLNEIMRSALNSDIQKISTNNEINYGIFGNMSVHVVSDIYSDGTCDDRQDSIDIKNWCYRKMSERLIDRINQVNKDERTFIATIGDNNRCFSETLGLNITEYHIFNLGDIYFEIRKLS